MVFPHMPQVQPSGSEGIDGGVGGNEVGTFADRVHYVHNCIIAVCYDPNLASLTSEVYVVRSQHQKPHYTSLPSLITHSIYILILVSP